MMKITNYYCISCDYTTSNKYNFNIHKTTNKHIKCTKSREIPEKSQKIPQKIWQTSSQSCIFTCKECDYTTADPCDYAKHTMTRKHVNRMILKPQTPKKYMCVYCRYNTNINKDYNKHILTKKHLQNVNNSGEQINEKEDEIAEPDTDTNTPLKNEFLQNTEDNTISIEKPLFMQLINDNQEFKKMLIEQHTKIIELSKTPLNIVNNTNTINAKINKFNMNVFLNEKCKDAMNINEFIESIKISFPDLEFVGTHGFVSGITKIVTDHLNKIDLYKRPIHCTDIKREVLHIKDEDQWLKDNNNEKTMNMIEKVAHKNLKMIGPWQKEHPNSQILDTKDYSLWWNIAKQSNNGTEHSQKNTTQVLKNVAKTVFIDKETLE